MSFVPRHHRYTYADYVGIETYSKTKHEFLDGEIYAMSGGTRDHSALAGSMIRLLGNAVGDRPCAVHTSDLRIYVEAVGLATYPDASVSCDPRDQPTTEQMQIQAPRVVVVVCHAAIAGAG